MMLTKPQAQKMICRAIGSDYRIRHADIHNVKQVDLLIEEIVRKHNRRNTGGLEETNGLDRVFYVDIRQIAELYCSTVKKNRELKKANI